MVKASNQKFIARNRAPRVQIEYEVEVYGAEKKIQLPFVIGVLADLSGMPAKALPRVDERKMLEIHVDNFDDRLETCKPRVAFRVPNSLTGEGKLAVEITFESMDDFSPDAVARKVEPLRRLLDARTQLANLLTYMDGKAGAEELIAKAIKDHELLQSLASTSEQGDEVGEAIEASDFSALVKHEFDLKSDRVQEAVEYAVKTLAEVALEQSAVIQNDAIKTIETMIAELDSRLTTQVNAILHHTELRKLEGTWRGLHYLVNNTETDEMLKIKIFSISKKDCFKTLKKFKGTAWTRARCSRRSTRRNTGPSAASPSAAWLATTILTTARRTCTCSTSSRRSQLFPTRLSSPARTPPHADGLLAGAVQSAGPHEVLPDPRVRPLALAAGVPGFPATSASPCRASSRVCPTGRRRIPSRKSTSRRTWKGPTTASTLGPTPPSPWPPTSPRRSSSTAGARASAASSPAGRWRGYRPIPSRPTTAAST